MTRSEDVSGSEISEKQREESDKLTYLNMLYFIPSLVIETSWKALKAGMPFGGTLGATLMVVMSNDSGDFPYAPFIAAAIALPIAFICDIIFYIPCIIIQYLKRGQQGPSYEEQSFS